MNLEITGESFVYVDHFTGSHQWVRTAYKKWVLNFLYICSWGECNQICGNITVLEAEILTFLNYETEIMLFWDICGFNVIIVFCDGNDTLELGRDI